MANIGIWRKCKSSVNNGDDFTCHAGAIKDPVKHIVPTQNILLHSPNGLHQRTRENIKADGQNRCAWMMVVFSEKWFSVVPSVPLTDILIKEVSLRAIWGWTQCSRRSTRQRCLCSHSMNATSKYIPPTACLSPNYCKVLSPEETKSGEFSGSADSVISQCSFFFCFCVAVEIWHIRRRRYRRLLKAENRKKNKKKKKLPSWSSR